MNFLSLISLLIAFSTVQAFKEPPKIQVCNIALCSKCTKLMYYPSKFFTQNQPYNQSNVVPPISQQKISLNSPYRITLRSIQARAPSGEIVFPDFSSTWVIFSSRLDLVKEIITRFCVSRGKMTHIDEKSGKTFLALGAWSWADGIFILWVLS